MRESLCKKFTIKNRYFIHIECWWEFVFKKKKHIRFIYNYFYGNCLYYLNPIPINLFKVNVIIILKKIKQIFFQRPF
jgi:hypothetical protein